MQPHPDFAIPINQPLDIETSVDPDGRGALVGRAIALGWWACPDCDDDPDHVPTGTLYLVVDPKRPRPFWVAQGDLVQVRSPDLDGPSAQTGEHEQ